MLHFCFASGSCIFATMFIPACCRQASTEVFSPLNSHCMKEQLDMWPSLQSWPIDSRPSQFYSRKGSAGRKRPMPSGGSSGTFFQQRKKQTWGRLYTRELWFFHHRPSRAGTERTASVYWGISQRLMTTLESSFNDRSLKNPNNPNYSRGVRFKQMQNS